jgi:hypothetical protein
MTRRTARQSSEQQRGNYSKHGFALPGDRAIFANTGTGIDSGTSRKHVDV